MQNWIKFWSRLKCEPETESGKCWWKFISGEKCFSHIPGTLINRNWHFFHCIANYDVTLSALLPNPVVRLCRSWCIAENFSSCLSKNVFPPLTVKHKSAVGAHRQSLKGKFPKQIENLRQRILNFLLPSHRALFCLYTINQFASCFGKFVLKIMWYLADWIYISIFFFLFRDKTFLSRMIRCSSSPSMRLL